MIALMRVVLLVMEILRHHHAHLVLIHVRVHVIPLAQRLVKEQVKVLNVHHVVQHALHHAGPIVVLVALQLARILVKIRHHNIALIVQATVLLLALQPARMLVKDKRRNIVPIAQLTVLLLARKNVQTPARHRHNKAALIALSNAVVNVITNAPMIVDASVTLRVAVNAKESAEVHVRWNAFRMQRTRLVLHAEERAEVHVTRIVHTTAILLVKA